MPDRSICASPLGRTKGASSERVRFVWIGGVGGRARYLSDGSPAVAGCFARLCPQADHWLPMVGSRLLSAHDGRGSEIRLKATNTPMGRSARSLPVVAPQRRLVVKPPIPRRKEAR